MIRFACPTCAKVMAVPDRGAGLKGRCTRCGQRLRIPDPLQRTVMGRFLPPAPRRAAVAPPPLPEEVEYPLPPTEARPRRPMGFFWGLLALLCSGAVVGGVLLPRPHFAAPVPKSGNAPPRDDAEDDLVRKIADHPFWETRPTPRQVNRLADLLTSLCGTGVVYIDDDFRQTPFVEDEPFQRAFEAQRNGRGGYVPEGVKKRSVHIDLGAGRVPNDRREALTDLLDSLDRAESDR